MTSNRTIVAITGILTLLAVGWTVYLSLDPEKYFYYRPEDMAAWKWDPLAVAVVCGIMIVGTGLISVVFVLQKPRRLWLRTLLILVPVGTWTFISTSYFLHMPAYVLFHHLWFFAITGVLLIVFLASLVSSVYCTWRMRLHADSQRSIDRDA
jgi:hypothetical protein